MSYTRDEPSPERFRRWAAHAVIGGVIERRIWSRLMGFNCYPGLFVLLVGEPASGKSVAVKLAVKLWTRCGKMSLAPSGMTKAAFIDHMGEQVKQMTYDGHAYRYHSMCIASSEFGVLVPDYDLAFLNVLNDWYDAGDIFDDRTRGGGLRIIERPHISFFAGTQPMYLKHILPDAAFGMGFTSRLVMVHSTKPKKKDMFAEDVDDEEMLGKLVNDLKLIQKQIGPIAPDPQAREFARTWYLEHADADAPTHSLLRSYVGRRHVTFQKLGMINAISRGSYFTINTQDYEKGLELMLETEADMPQIFKEMAASPDAKELEEMAAYIKLYCKETGEDSVPEAALTTFISKRVPVGQIDFFLNTLLRTKKMALAGANIPGSRKFKPSAQKVIET